MVFCSSTHEDNPPFALFTVVFHGGRPCDADSYARGRALNLCTSVCQRCARTVFYAFPVARMLHDATAECRHCHTTINHKYKYTRVCENRAQIYEIPRLLTTMARRSSSVRITWHGSGPSASRRGNVNKAHTSCLRRTVFRGLMHKPLDRRLCTHTHKCAHDNTI